ncbi:MAG: hypothetical protein ISR95_03785 [Candidatus Marinimicrobia bacterium]|nr:hypothetical protein [candidate division KSB1 bacterium]MBL7046734.1 hypothetical protein [Candidatus Neomarinimicrobiota bacterium]
MQSTPDRRLAAIVFTDIAGFTALSAEDEERALSLIDQQRELLKPIVEKYNGKWLKEMGDGLLLSFKSTKQAVNCAIEIQKATKSVEGLNLRIGIHQGDILEKEGDVFGDDVNIASRIEPFAAVGGVAISDKVNRDISGSPEITTKYVGRPRLKGVTQKVEIYCLTSYGLPQTVLKDVSAKLEREEGDEALLGKRLRAQLTIKNVVLFAVSTWLLINSLQFIFTNLSPGNMLGLTLRPSHERLRMGVIDFESGAGEIDFILLQAVKSELYKYLQLYKKLTLIGDFELDQIDIKSLSRKEISSKLDSDFLVTGYLTKTNHHYLVESELYQMDRDHIVTHFSQRFPVLSLQETSMLIADTLSNHYAAVLGISKQKLVTKTTTEGDSGFTILGAFGKPIFDIEIKTTARMEISHHDKTYQALVKGRQLLGEETLEANLDAIVLFETAVLDDETNGDLISALAEAYYQRGRMQSGASKLFSNAEELLTKAIYSDNISTDALATAHYLMSEILLTQGDLTKARESIRRARKLNRSDPIIHQQFKKLTKLYLQKLGG